jgi:hypothetical protein
MKLEFTVERGAQPGVLIASWNDPDGGGISTQANGIAELMTAIQKAVECHFVGRSQPKRVAIHFTEVAELELV